MRAKRMIAALLALATVSSVGLVGCSSKSESTSSGKTESKETEVSSNFNPTGDKIVNEPVTFKIVAAKEAEVGNFNEIQFFKDYEEKTNVHIEWDIYSSEAWKEQKNLLFAASGSMPDAFFGMWTLEDLDIVKYGSQGLLVPLEGYLDEYGVNLQKLLDRDPAYEKLMKSPDGHVYGLPGIDESTGGINGPIYIQKNWLDKVGMSVPTTTDELYDVLKAFKAAGDLNGNGIADEIPLGFRFDSLINGFYQWLGAFDMVCERNFMMSEEDGSLKFVANTPEYRQALEYFNKLYSEGLVDPESFTQTDSVYTSKFKSADSIYGVGTIWSMHNLFGTDDPAVTGYVPIEPLKGPNGAQKWMERPGGLRTNGTFAITTACKNPEILVRWADGMYETDTATQAYYGLEDVALERKADGGWKKIQATGGSEDLRHAQAPGKRAIPGITREIYDSIEKDSSLIERDTTFAMYEPFIYEVPKKPMRTIEEADELGIIEVEITEYVKKMTAEFISKGITDAGWETYCQGLQNLRVERYIELYNQINSRFLGE